MATNHQDKDLDAFQSPNSNGAVVTVPVELVEKMLASAQRPLSDIIGDPTPLGIIGFCMSLTPLSCDLMGWRGAGGFGGAEIGVYLYYGGLLMLVAGFVQLVLRQMFLCLVFMSFGSFWLFFAATLQPFYAASAAYGGPDKPGFPASLGFFLLSFSILSFFFLICGLRTNIVIEFLLLTVTLGLCLLTGLLWALADGNLKSAHDCKIGAGACLFACSMSGLYFLLALMLPTVDFPLQLPLGDLSHIVPSMTQKTQASRTAREDTKA